MLPTEWFNRFWESSCTNKLRHDDFDAAYWKVRNVRGYTRPYYCLFCGGWHLTTQKQVSFNAKPHPAWAYQSSWGLKKKARTKFNKWLEGEGWTVAHLQGRTLPWGHTMYDSMTICNGTDYRYTCGKNPTYDMIMSFPPTLPVMFVLVHGLSKLKVKNMMAACSES